MRSAIDHPLHGEVVIEYDTTSGAITVEFERLECEDAIMPNYRVALTSEHLAAWVRWVLTTRYGRRCNLLCWTEEMTTGKKRGRLHALLRQTERDPGLAYCTASGSRVILIRGGRVLKVGLCLEGTMGEFGLCLKEEGGDTLSVARVFADYVHGLML